MPMPSGFDVLAALRRDHPGVPVIMVARPGRPAISDRLLAKGAFAYVEKPFTMERLDAVIRAALAGLPAP